VKIAEKKIERLKRLKRMNELKGLRVEGIGAGR
jgi:hypothetical protein